MTDTPENERPEGEDPVSAAEPPPDGVPAAVSQPAGGRRRWLRSLLQFRLRTLMLLTVGAAIATQWWLRPQPEEFEFGMR